MAGWNYTLLPVFGHINIISVRSEPGLKLEDNPMMIPLSSRYVTFYVTQEMGKKASKMLQFFCTVPNCLLAIFLCLSAAGHW